MPRAARVIAENGIYHVVNRGNGRATKNLRVPALQAYPLIFPLLIYVYCFMC